MSSPQEISDARLLDLIGRRESLSIADLIQECGVTATAVRQRLTRLMEQGLIQRIKNSQGRGRPEHRYSLTDKARRQSGNNYADLAQVLWTELRNLKDEEVRRGLLQRVADHLTQLYRGEVTGSTPLARLESVKELLDERRVPATVGEINALPVLTVMACPYPELAARDRSVCSMEKMMLSELLETPVRLSQCRLDGHECCQFQTR
ncbi:MAG: MarR family transcriptional regulator [Planctomycetia bacterium]|nr:MarR family transcriptional regulator [Planctomycetia bacterium]